MQLRYLAHDVGIIAELMRVQRLAGFSLEPAASESLVDLYLDTARHALLDQGFALRLRQHDGAFDGCLYTLGRQTATGASQEDEGPREARTDDRRQVVPGALPLPLRAADLPLGPLRSALQALTGEQPLVLQARVQTERAPRTLYEADRAVGMLHVDAVRYEWASSEAAVHEVGFAAPEPDPLHLPRLDAMLRAYGLQRLPRARFASVVEYLSADATAPLLLLPAERRALDAIAAGPSPVLRRRAEAIAAVHRGQSVPEAAREAGMDAERVRQWIARFRAHRMALFDDEPAPRDRAGYDQAEVYPPQHTGDSLAFEAGRPRASRPHRPTSGPPASGSPASAASAQAEPHGLGGQPADDPLLPWLAETPPSANDSGRTAPATGRPSASPQSAPRRPVRARTPRPGPSPAADGPPEAADPLRWDEGPARDADEPPRGDDTGSTFASTAQPLERVSVLGRVARAVVGRRGAAARPNGPGAQARAENLGGAGTERPAATLRGTDVPLIDSLADDLAEALQAWDEAVGYLGDHPDDRSAVAPLARAGRGLLGVLDCYGAFLDPHDAALRDELHTLLTVAYRVRSFEVMGRLWPAEGDGGDEEAARSVAERLHDRHLYLATQLRTHLEATGGTSLRSKADRALAALAGTEDIVALRLRHVLASSVWHQYERLLVRPTAPPEAADGIAQWAAALGGLEAALRRAFPPHAHPERSEALHLRRALARIEALGELRAACDLLEQWEGRLRDLTLLRLVQQRLLAAFREEQRAWTEVLEAVLGRRFRNYLGMVVAAL